MHTYIQSSIELDLIAIDYWYGDAVALLVDGNVVWNRTFTLNTDLTSQETIQLPLANPGQNQTGQNQTGQNQTGQNQTGQNQTGQNQTGQNNNSQNANATIQTNYCGSSRFADEIVHVNLTIPHTQRALSVRLEARNSTRHPRDAGAYGWWSIRSDSRVCVCENDVFSCVCIHVCVHAFCLFVRVVLFLYACMLASIACSFI